MEKFFVSEEKSFIGLAPDEKKGEVESMNVLWEI